MLLKRCLHCQRYIKPEVLVCSTVVPKSSLQQSQDVWQPQLAADPQLLGGRHLHPHVLSPLAIRFPVFTPPVGEANKAQKLELPNFLEYVSDSISRWKITDPEDTTEFSNRDVLDPVSIVKRVQLPTSERNKVSEKQARIGGKYKRPAYKRLRIKRRHFKKAMRKNRHKIKQREILERNENLKRWKEEFKVIQAQEKDAQSRIESVKESQRDLVRKIRDIIDSNPQIVNKIVDNVDSEFKEKLSLLNTVEKVSSKEEDLIRQIYKKK